MPRPEGLIFARAARAESKAEIINWIFILTRRPKRWNFGARMAVVCACSRINRTQGSLAMTRKSQTVKAALNREASEMARSFAAGAAYMAAILVVGGAATAGAVNFSKTAIPQLLEEVSPTKFPRYAAHDMNRAERWNPDRWDTEISDEHGNENNASKMASYEASGQ